MAALMPQTMPWSRALRGSSDGVKARQANASATHAPGSVYRNRRRPAAAVGGDGSGCAPAPAGVGAASSVALEVAVGAPSRCPLIDTSYPQGWAAVLGGHSRVSRCQLVLSSCVWGDPDAGPFSPSPLVERQAVPPRGLPPATGWPTGRWRCRSTGGSPHPPEHTARGGPARRTR